MPVIWGLDLKEMRWGNFKSSYLFGNRDFHLRRTKFVVYQCAMILCVCSESVGTAALSGTLADTLPDYVKQQSEIERLHSSARVHNDDFVGIASFNIFVGIAVATIFGAGFFFDLFFPNRWEPMNIRWAWRISAVVVSIMCLADAIVFTVILATGKASITANAADAAAIASVKLTPTIVYRHNDRGLASVILLWLGLVATIASTVIMFVFYRHYGLYGAKSHGARWREGVEKGGEAESPSPPPRG